MYFCSRRESFAARHVERTGRKRRLRIQHGREYCCQRVTNRSRPQGKPR